MAEGYTPRIWQKGEVLTADGVNHLEQGVASVVDQVKNGPVVSVAGKKGDVLLGFSDLASSGWVGAANASSSQVKYGLSTRTNYAPDPYAINSAFGAWLGRTFGTNGAGTYEYKTDDEIVTGLDVKTFVRKTWTSAPTSNDGTGFQVHPGYLDVAAGESVTVSGYLRTTREVIAALARIDWFDSSNNLLSSDTLSYPISYEWSRVSVTATAPNGAVKYKATLDIRGDESPWAIGDSLDGTGALVEKSDQLGPVFSGASYKAITKADVNLGNVDNTADLDKPISNATQQALSSLSTSTQTALGAKANSAVKVTGTGSLSGGGDLTADRTIDLSAATKTTITGKAESTRKISTAAALTGGGDLSADLTLDLSAASKTSLGKADTAVQPAALNGTYQRVIVYASGAYPARPSTSSPVKYIGPVVPTTWLPNDEWVNNA